MFRTICIVIFILLQLVSGADRDDNGEGRKSRPRDKTNNDPQCSEDDGTSDSSIRDNKKNEKSGGRNRALQNANDGTVGLDRLMTRSANEWLEFETEDLRCACLGVGLLMTGPRQVLAERLVEFYSSLSSILPSGNPHPYILSSAPEPAYSGTSQCCGISEFVSSTASRDIVYQRCPPPSVSQFPSNPSSFLSRPHSSDSHNSMSSYSQSFPLLSVP